MKRLSQRQRLVCGALAGAGLIWAVDALTRDSTPSAALAGPSTAAAGPSAPAVVWQDVSATIAALTEEGYVSVANELERLERDLFVPTALIDAALRSAEELEAEQAAAVKSEQDEAAEFRGRHRLVGVMLGRRPLAVVDDEVLALQGELDGWRLADIQRERAVFLHPQLGIQVVLELEQGPGIP